MQRNCVGLNILLVLLGCVLPVRAQEGASETFPSIVKFAGTLTGFTGKPLRGIVEVNFYLYEEKEGGIPLWMETQNVRFDQNGHYSVMLGSTQALPAEAFIGGGARWLSVQASGQAEQPRTLLFSLPYGGPAMASRNQTHGEDTGSPQSNPILPPNVHGNGVVNFIPVWTAKNIIGESVIKQSGSNVGIGTTTPASTLDVFSSTAGVHAPMAQFGSKGTTDSNSILTYNGTGTTEMFQSGCPNCFVPGAQAGDGGVRVSPGKSLFLGDSGTSRLRIDSLGNDSQPRVAGGMVKAMFFYDAFADKIVRCFNSNLSGAAASKPPCGFGWDKTGVGDYIIDLGFQVNDRFLSLTSNGTWGNGPGSPDQLSICLNACEHTLTANQVEVATRRDDTFVDTQVWVLVY
jgi:hypothetical protein